MKTIAVESIDLTIVEAHSSNGANWEKLVAQLNTAQETIERQAREIEILRRYGNKDCTAMADEALQTQVEVDVTAYNNIIEDCGEGEALDPDTTDQCLKLLAEYDKLVMVDEWNNIYEDRLLAVRAQVKALKDK